MKTLMLIASLLIAGTAMAGEYTNYGRITFQKAATSVPANKVCQDSGFLYHKTKTSVAVDYCEHGNSNCTTVMKPLVQAMNSTRKVCSAYNGPNGNCTSWKTVSFKQGTTKAKVYANQHDMEEDRNPKSVFSYTVDTCN